MEHFKLSGAVVVVIVW